MSARERERKERESKLKQTAHFDNRSVELKICIR